MFKFYKPSQSLTDETFGRVSDLRQLLHVLLIYTWRPQSVHDPGFSHRSLNAYQLCDGRSQHHELLVSVEEDLQTMKVTVLLVRKLLLSQVPGHDRLHL